MKLDLSTYTPYGVEPIETASRDEIAGLQAARLRSTLRRVYDNVSTYRSKFDTAGVHPDDLQQCLRIYTEAFDTRQPFVMQYRLRRHDGEYRWVSDNGVPRYDSQKNFAGYIGSCIEITELLSKEEALREFEERVTLAAQAAHLGVWELDTATNASSTPLICWITR